VNNMEYLFGGMIKKTIETILRKREMFGETLLLICLCNCQLEKIEYIFDSLSSRIKLQ
jgi:hypothetical protein